MVLCARIMFCVVLCTGLMPVKLFNVGITFSVISCAWWALFMVLRAGDMLLVMFRAGFMPSVMFISRVVLFVVLSTRYMFRVVSRDVLHVNTSLIV
jgi:hypothetical protein